jgi:CheY-like chemotaxis protein
LEPSLGKEKRTMSHTYGLLLLNDIKKMQITHHISITLLSQHNMVASLLKCLDKGIFWGV